MTLGKTQKNAIMKIKQGLHRWKYGRFKMRTEIDIHPGLLEEILAQGVM